LCEIRKKLTYSIRMMIKTLQYTIYALIKQNYELS
jgi:hypothetical protein